MKENDFKDTYDSWDEFFDDFAKHFGVKRYSEEYNRLIWTKLIRASEEDYDEFYGKIREMFFGKNN